MNKAILLMLAAVLLISFTIVYAGDLADVQESGVVVMGVSPDKAPFVSYDDNDDLTGIDIKLMEEIASRMGLELEVSEMASDDLIGSLNIGQVDVLGSAFSKTASHQNHVDFTRVYYIAEAVFLAKNTLLMTQPVTAESFTGKKIGALKNSGFEEWLNTELLDDGTVQKKDIYTYGRMDDAVRALDRGKIDLLMIDLALYQSQFEGNSAYRMYEYGSIKDSYAFGLRKGSDLRTEINNALTAMLKDGTAQEIANRFFSDEEPETAVITWNAKQPTATPTAAPSVTPIPTKIQATAASVIPTAAAATCSYSMAYVADVTIPDGQPISAGSSFTKTWRIRNTGNCAWTQDFYFAFVSGSQMSGANTYLPATVYPGDSVDISVYLTAPSAEGTYQGNWQLKTPQGYGIGYTLWVQIIVPSTYSGSSSEPIYTAPTSTHVSSSSVSSPTSTPAPFHPETYPITSPFVEVDPIYSHEYPTATPVVSYPIANSGSDFFINQMAATATPDYSFIQNVVDPNTVMSLGTLAVSDISGIREFRRTK